MMMFSNSDRDNQQILTHSRSVRGIIFTALHSSRKFGGFVLLFHNNCCVLSINQSMNQLAHELISPSPNPFLFPLFACRRQSASRSQHQDRRTAPSLVSGLCRLRCHGSARHHNGGVSSGPQYPVPSS